MRLTTTSIHLGPQKFPERYKDTFEVTVN